VDTQTDPTLYNAETGRAAVDMLCEQALALALVSVERSMDVLTGCTGGRLFGGDAEELTKAMALPAALPLFPLGTAAAELPVADRGICILALPRTGIGGKTSALDLFLAKGAGALGQRRVCDIFFVYPADGKALLREAATASAETYSHDARNTAVAVAVEAPAGAV
jgi:hypothetical protein